MSSALENLSIGHISAGIAAGIVFLQFLLPNALILVLVRLVSHEQTAASWSVAARQLLISHWPLILRSETTTSSGVSPLVAIVAWLRPISLLLVAIAAVVTPLGLKETVGLRDETTPVTFRYLADTGPMGTGTPQRSQFGFARQCGQLMCPGITTTSETGNATIDGDRIDFRVPDSMGRLYQSGLAGQQSSLSSIFDIQTRQYVLATENSIQNASYTEMSFRALANSIADRKIVAVEGLIVDYESGGIGFRNHTAPVNLDFGAEWEEDVLWWQPETACVDLNLTLQKYEHRDGERTPLDYTAVVVNAGGFSTINRTDPHDVWGYGYNTQDDPQLLERAYRAAWTTDVYNMLVLNLSEPGTNRSRLSSAIGDAYPVALTFGLDAGYTSAKTVSDFGALFASAGTALDPDFTSTTGGRTFSTAYPNGTVVNNTNAWNITIDDFDSVNSKCQFLLPEHEVNMTNIDITCGLVFGSGRPAKGANFAAPAPGDTWERPIYSCSSATKSSIKTVRFAYNGTTGPGLAGLQVLSLKDKTYADEASRPIWAMDHADPPHRLIDLEPLWGLVSQEEADAAKDISARQSGHFYIPASADSLFLGLGTYRQEFSDKFLPGIRGPPIAWHNAYNIPSAFVGDYTGEDDIELAQLWASLTATAAEAPLMLNLVWTDIAANAFVGTRSRLTRGSLPPNMAPSVQSLSDSSTVAEGPSQTDVFYNELSTQAEVFVRVRKLQYRWTFAIPAAIVLALAAGILFSALIAVCLGATPSRVRRYLFYLSPGRLLADAVYGNPHSPEVNEAHTLAQRKALMMSDTSDWLAKVGRRPIVLGDTVEGRFWTGSDRDWRIPRRHSLAEGELRERAQLLNIEVNPKSDLRRSTKLRSDVGANGPGIGACS